jgi:tetratricopeptide (TPR) repeat protein
MSGTISGTFVIARNTAFTYKGKPTDAKAIGKDLGVRYVLEGSVQFVGAQARVNAQLIDATSGAHLWAEQFDTPRADLLQTQDTIVIHLARAMEIQLTQAEAVRLKRTPPGNPDAEDLALQGFAAVVKGGYVSKEADAGYSLCEQALAIDPNNVRALWVLSMKFHVPVLMGMSTDPKNDVRRADELVSKALTLDPDNAAAHNSKAWILNEQGRFEEAIAERERTLALDPADLNAMMSMGFDYASLGRYEKGPGNIQRGDSAQSARWRAAVYVFREIVGLFRVEPVRSGDRLGAPGDWGRAELPGAISKSRCGIGFDRS